MRVLKFIAAFLLHLTLVIGGVLFGSLGLFALLSDSPLTARVSTSDAIGCAVTGLLIAAASFLVTPRLALRAIQPARSEVGSVAEGDTNIDERRDIVPTRYP